MRPSWSSPCSPRHTPPRSSSSLPMKSSASVSARWKASARVGLDEVRAFLGQVNVSLPKGSVDGEKASYAIYSNDQLFEAGQYRNLVLAQKNGVPIRLGAVADIID